MARPRIAPASFRRISLFALLALSFIVVTGAAVRLTGSGLGCSDWPACEDNRLVAPLEFHALVEFTNRVVTGVVAVAIALAVLGSRWRVPVRSDLTMLAWGLVVGLVAQILLGGITVLTHLSPPIVMAHFLVSMVLVADAVLLHHRAGLPDEAGNVVERHGGRLPFAVVAAAAVVVFTGTLVTAAGPHGGDADVERLAVDVPDVARLHGLAVVALVALAVALLVASRPHARLSHGAEILLVVLVLQAAIGYVQYFNDVPEVLVGIHIGGAIAVWVSALRTVLIADERSPRRAEAAVGQ